jgi:formiminoglutamase
LKKTVPAIGKNSGSRHNPATFFMSSFLRILSQQDGNALVSRRTGEVKLGERILFADPGDWETSLRSTEARFVLLGIPEDIGVRANGGIGGAHTAWPAALASLLNIQATDKLDGAELVVLGAFDCSEWMQAAADLQVEGLRALVAQIDQEVASVIEVIVRAGKVPIVIGGGHNNAYGLLKGASLAQGQPLNCINLDAHSDYRKMEGRHSGNGFRYAKAEQYLQRYAIVGLHENYNSAAIIADLDADTDLHYSFFEDIFLRKSLSFEEALRQAAFHTQATFTGIELDLDCIQGVLSSAATPSGISSLQARQYIHYCTQHTKPCYLHLTEGASQLANGRADMSTGKLIAYLVSDFIKGMKH